MPYERSVGFASLRNSGRSTSGIHARPLSKVRCCRPKKFGRLPEGLLLHQPSQNRTIPCFAPSHLPPLSKVRCCRPKNSGDYLRDCSLYAPTLPKPHYPLLCTTTLASLVKGRWIDGKQQTVALLRFACDMSTFLIYQTFCRQDGGIATPLFLASHQPSQNRTIPCFAPSHLPPLSKVRCCRPKKFGRLPEGLPPVAPNLSIPTTIAKER